MPLLGGLLTTLFGSLVAWLTTYVTRKVAFGLAAVATYSALTLALYVVFRGVVSAINAQAHGAPSIFISALQLAVPPVSTFCVGSYMTMWTACTVYTWQRDLLKLVVKA